MFFFFNSLMIKSDVLQDKAKIVQVGFLSAWETNGPASTTNRFLQSCAWQLLFKAEVTGLFPILVVPTSWMILPGPAKPYMVSAPGFSPNRTAPELVRIYSKVSCMCFACLIS